MKTFGDCNVTMVPDLDVDMITVCITREIYEDIRDQLLKSKSNFYKKDFVNNLWVDYNEI